MLDILYRDEQLVAIAKPAGLLVHRSMLDRHETRFAVQLLRDQIGQQVHPVHRLDRGTSGILLFALDRETARAACAQFEAQDIDKTYLAIVRGHPDAAGRIDHPLSRQRDTYGNTCGDISEFPPKSPQGTAQAARTDYRRLATTELPFAVDRYPTSRYALLELKPHSGRRHQIRRHLKHLAHPIIGDATYGKGCHNRFFQTQFACRRLLLACTSLCLQHPRRGTPLRITAPLSEDFAQVVSALGWEHALPESVVTRHGNPECLHFDEIRE